MASNLVIQDLAPQPGHQPVHVVHVVDGQQGGCQRLLGLEQVVQIGEAAGQGGG